MNHFLKYKIFVQFHKNTTCEHILFVSNKTRSFIHIIPTHKFNAKKIDILSFSFKLRSNFRHQCNTFHMYE